MKAVCYYGKEDVRVEHVPDPQILNPRDAIVKITATAICGSDLHIYDGYIPTMQKGDVSATSSWARSWKSAREHETEGWRPRRRAVHHRVRPLFLLQGAALVALRQLEPECVDGRKAVRLFGGRAVRLFAHLRRLRRRPGRVRARAVRRRRSAEGAIDAVRRTGAVPVRHLSDRLHGGG
jgi:hypothetical protein